MPGQPLLQQLIAPGENWQLLQLAHKSSSLIDLFPPEPPYLRSSSVFSHIAVAFQDSPDSIGELSDSAGASDTASAYFRKDWITKAWISGPVRTAEVHNSRDELLVRFVLISAGHHVSPK